MEAQSAGLASLVTRTGTTKDRALVYTRVRRTERLNESGSWWTKRAPDDCSGRHEDEWWCAERSEYPVKSEEPQTIGDQSIFASEVSGKMRRMSSLKTQTWMSKEAQNDTRSGQDEASRI
jgi:hypothetical protein